MKFCIFLAILILTESYPIEDKFNNLNNEIEKDANEINYNGNSTVPGLNHISSERKVLIGTCTSDNQRLRTEEIQIETEGPSTLNGTVEFFIGSPIKITCIEILDKNLDHTIDVPSLNSGGPGYNWFSLNVKSAYAKGIHFFVNAFGIVDMDEFKQLKLNEV